MRQATASSRVSAHIRSQFLQQYGGKRVCTRSRFGSSASLRLIQASALPPSPAQGKKSWDIKMLYDGDCPLCMREVNMLRNRDKGIGKIDFVDISSPEYSAKDNSNISYEQAMGEIHAILPDGKVVKNVEVFRRLYEAVGLGWIYAITKLGPIGKAADWVYGIWAKYRMQITGRSDFATVFAEKKSCKIQ